MKQRDLEGYEMYFASINKAMERVVQSDVSAKRLANRGVAVHLTSDVLWR